MVDWLSVDNKVNEVDEVDAVIMMSVMSIMSVINVVDRRSVTDAIHMLGRMCRRRMFFSSFMYNHPIRLSLQAILLLIKTESGRQIHIMLAS